MARDVTLRTTSQDRADSREGNNLYPSSSNRSEAVETGPANEWVSDDSLIDPTIDIAPTDRRQLLTHSPR